MCITWPRICFTVHLLWCISYTIIGTIQVIVGVFFFALQFLKLCSNIWIGILNILFGLGGSVYAMVGTWTLAKQRAFLYMAITVLVVNVVNLVLLEVGEWHILLPENAKKLIEQGNLKMLLLYARTIANLSTLVAAFIAFIDSQITFCSMQYHERYYKKKSDKQDVLSDTEYVLPRVKSDSDENENASYFNKPYGQSWVYKTSTAESSTANSVPNRNSGASSDNLIEAKPTLTPTPGSEVDSKEMVSGQKVKAKAEQPVVVVEKTADYTDRQLHYMTSFSRTPSPVPASDSSSENSCSMPAPQLQERLKRVVDQAASNYRARLDSAKSTGAIVAERHSPCVSPRPPSVSGGEQLQPRHDSLTAADLQETSSQRSFKISADQIFIPLKDETVIRINDEVFVTPNKPRRSSPQPDAASASRPQSGCSPADHAKSVSFSAAADKAPSPTVDKVKSALPEVVDVIRKELIHKKSFGQPLPSPQLQSPGEKPTSPPSTFEPAEPPACPPPTATSPTDERPTTLASGEQSLEDAMRQFLGSAAAPDDKRELTPSPKDANVPSPTLERQTKVEHDDAAELELENEPYMFSRSQFDRQDTVIAATTLPPPTVERQTFIERQDAISILSPREDKSYILPPPQDELDSFPSPIETEASIGADTEDELAVSDEVDSNCSNNASVDKDTILDFKVSDDELEAVAAQQVQLPQFPDICDIPGRGVEVVQSSSHSLGNEIDNIFKIAEDPRLDDEVDREDADLFNLSSQSQQIDVDNIPPPDLDASTFADIPPPEETEDINGVDPEEWEESDDDSMNSSCVRRIPPPSTPND